MKVINKMNNKMLVMAICITTMLCVTLFGTLAYLTDTSGVTNVFTLGKVDISLTESPVDENGKIKVDQNGDPIVDSDGKPVRTQGNQYKLIPGAVYDKDPTLTIIKDSEESYVRMIVKVYNASEMQKILDNQKNGLTNNGFLGMLGELNTADWVLVSNQPAVKDNIMSFEFRYKEKVKGEEADKNLPPLFKKLIIPGALNADEINALYNGNPKFQIVVEGHAIQALGFDTVDEAWAAFDDQYAAENAIPTP